MPHAETVLDEATATQLGGQRAPKPGKYYVLSTGAPQQVPLEAVVTIAFMPGGLVLRINEEDRGPVMALGNGDFKVEYSQDGYDLVLQFRQDSDSYLYGVSMPVGAEPRMGDDPPITGVWGAEARPGGGTTEPGK